MAYNGYFLRNFNHKILENQRLNLKHGVGIAIKSEKTCKYS